MNERSTLKINNQGQLTIGGISVNSLVSKYGTPLYVMDQAHIEKMCQIFTEVFKTEKINGKVCYASKAFCCKEMYRLIDKYNLCADVVSAGELYTAKSANFNMDKIVFHGNNKTINELEMAVDFGVKTIVIDSIIEAERLNKICQEKNIIKDIFIRVNPSIEAHTHHYIQTAKIDSKFGFSIDNGDAISAILKIKSLSNLNLKGLHCHIGSQIFEEKSFLLAVEKMINFYKILLEKYSISFSSLDIGGGFGIWYSEGDRAFTYEDYSNMLKNIVIKLKKCILDAKISMPELIIEPGRSLVGEAGITLYTVGSVKEITNVKKYLAIDGGMFENPRYALYQAKYTVVPALKMKEKCTEKYTIAGKCCESGDKIADDVMLPKMQEGDILAVLSTGAYNYSMASNYNRNLIPPVVFVKDGEDRVVVKGQTLEDIIKNDL